MSFWSTSSGGNAAETATTEYDIGGGFVIIPDGSTVLAVVDSVGWAKDQNFMEYIEVRWAVTKPEELAGAKVFQKLWVKGLDPKAKDAEAGAKKRDKALKMLATIDANAGGKLARSGQEPDDDALTMALTNKPMTIKVMVWEMNGNQGNWVAAVMPKDRAISLTGPIEKKASTPAATTAKDDLDDDSIPF